MNLKWIKKSLILAALTLVSQVGYAQQSASLKSLINSAQGSMNLTVLTAEDVNQIPAAGQTSTIQRIRNMCYRAGAANALLYTAYDLARSQLGENSSVTQVLHSAQTETAIFGRFYCLSPAKTNVSVFESDIKEYRKQTDAVYSLIETGAVKM